jgi:hypothetical protein
MFVAGASEYLLAIGSTNSNAIYIHLVRYCIRWLCLNSRRGTALHGVLENSASSSVGEKFRLWFNFKVILIVLLLTSLIPAFYYC